MQASLVSDAEDLSTLRPRLWMELSGARDMKFDSRLPTYVELADSALRLVGWSGFELGSTLRV